jgi:hypothetical protein
LVDVVRGAVGGDGAFQAGAGAGVVASERLDDVILDEGVHCPSVDGEVAVAVRAKVAVIGNGSGRLNSVNDRFTTQDNGIKELPCRSGVPSLSTDKVAGITGPLDIVFTATAVVVGDRTCTVSPERVVVTVVGASRARGGAREKLRVVSRKSKSSNNGEGSKDERGDANHDEDERLLKC